MHYVFLLYALFASVFTIAKTALNQTEPFFLVGFRMLIAGILLISYEWIIKKQTFQFDRKTWIRLALFSLFSIYLTNVFEFWGLQYLTSFKTCFIYSLSPFLSALFSYFLFMEQLSIKKWIGLLVGFAGFIPVMLTQTVNEEEIGGLLVFSWPELSVVMAAICGVYGWILLRQLVNDHALSPMTTNGVSMSMGGLFALIHSYFVESWTPLPTTNVPVFLECTFLLIIISNFICYNLYGNLLKKYSATFMSFAGFSTPLFTALFGWMFLGEIPTLSFYISLLIVFLGLFIFHQEELKRPTEELATSGL